MLNVEAAKRCVSSNSPTLWEEGIFGLDVSTCVCVCTSAEMISELVPTRNLCVYCFFVIFI